MPPKSSQPANSPKPKNRLGDVLFYSVAAVLGLIALCMIGYIVWDGWQSANAEPTELVISRAELNLPETPAPELLDLPRAETSAGAEASTAAAALPSATVPAPPTEPAPEQSVTPPPATAPPTPFSGQERSPTLLKDDFSTDLLGWSTISREASLRGYAGGAYFIEVSAPSVYALSFIPVEFSPTRLSFEAATGNEPQGGTFGVLCQYQDESNFTLIEVRPDTGELAVGTRQAGEYTALTDPEWQAQAQFNTTLGAINRFEITCTPEAIQVRINGVPAAQVSVPQPLWAGKQAALFTAGGPEANGVVFRMYFDNLTAQSEN
jgi:hypothetical protein